MISEFEAPFETIESAQEYLGLLVQALAESREVVERDITRQVSSASLRHIDALRLVVYNLEKLGVHLERSRRILNDLRTLRRLLHEERSQVAA